MQVGRTTPARCRAWPGERGFGLCKFPGLEVPEAVVVHGGQVCIGVRGAGSADAGATGRWEVAGRVAAWHDRAGWAQGAGRLRGWLGKCLGALLGHFVM